MTPEKLTKNQRLVLDCLHQSSAAMTAYDILDVVRVGGIRAPVQVYRALEHLLETGAVHRIESMNAYVACAHQHDHDAQFHTGTVAFAICDDCGTVSEITAEKAAKTLDHLASDSGFVTKRAVVELRGHCGACVRNV